MNDECATVYDRINRRVQIMFEKGLVSEVKHLMEMGCKREMVAMQGLGYKEVIDSLEGRYSLEEAKEIIQKETRHFAKRQLTWFRREEDVIWVNKNELQHSDEKILQYMLDCISKRKITI